MGTVVIPTEYMGLTLDSAEICRVLRELNVGFHFDLGGNHNIWHPKVEKRQGVFFNGKHICSMDRGMVPEFPIHSVKSFSVSVPSHELTLSERMDPMTLQEFLVDDKGMELPTGTHRVKRKQRDKVLLVGWRHTLGKILSKEIPGVTQPELEARLKISLHFIEDDTGVDVTADTPEGRQLILAG